MVGLAPVLVAALMGAVFLADVTPLVAWLEVDLEAGEVALALAEPFLGAM